MGIRNIPLDVGIGLDQDPGICFHSLCGAQCRMGRSVSCPGGVKGDLNQVLVSLGFVFAYVCSFQ